MRRKVIKLGENSLLVSLPSSWVKKHGISKGDEVEVSASPNHVVITSKQSEKKNRILALAEDPEIAARQIRIAYKKGMDELEVRYENPKAYAAAISELKNLIGFEVIESGKKYSRIKNIATAEAGDFSTVLRRVFLTLLDMAESTEECAKGSKDALEHVMLAENDIDRLTDFCKRLLNKQGAGENHEITMHYSLLKDIERIADSYAILAKSKIPRQVQVLLSQARTQLRAVYDLFYSYDHTRVANFLKELKQLDSSAEKMLREKSFVAVHHIAGIIKMLNEMSWAVCSRPIQ
ncbi:MAG: AbrB/MazE/SpoVT family DNA-binding domain-containing protein [Candidatus Woesearchaeota archaeon]